MSDPKARKKWPSRVVYRATGQKRRPKAYKKTRPIMVEAMRRDIADWRARLGLSQRALGALLGCTENSIANWESGRAAPDPLWRAVLFRLTRLAPTPAREALNSKTWADKLAAIFGGQGAR